MLDAYTRESITVIAQRYLSVLRFCRWSKLVRHQKPALFGSEIRMERSHSIFCTNRHKIDITLYCSLVGLNTSTEEKDIQLCLLVKQTGTIIADDMYVYIGLVCTAITYL